MPEASARVTALQIGEVDMIVLLSRWNAPNGSNAGHYRNPEFDKGMAAALADRSGEGQGALAAGQPPGHRGSDAGRCEGVYAMFGVEGTSHWKSRAKSDNMILNFCMEAL